MIELCGWQPVPKRRVRLWQPLSPPGPPSRKAALSACVVKHPPNGCSYRDHDALRSMYLIGASANRLTRYGTSPSLCSVRSHAKPRDEHPPRDDQASMTGQALVFGQLPEALADKAPTVMSFPVLARLMCRLWVIHRTRAGQGQPSVLTARPSGPAVDRQERFMGSWGDGKRLG